MIDFQEVSTWHPLDTVLNWKAGQDAGQLYSAKLKAVQLALYISVRISIYSWFLCFINLSQCHFPPIICSNNLNVNNDTWRSTILLNRCPVEWWVWITHGWMASRYPPSKTKSHPPALLSRAQLLAIINIPVLQNWPYGIWTCGIKVYVIIYHSELKCLSDFVHVYTISLW